MLIAQRNLALLRCARGAIMLWDAAEFKNLDPYTFLYMYNPFPEVDMRSVLDNIRDSVLRVPRRLTLVYKCPVFHDLVIATGFRQIAEFKHHVPMFRVYAHEQSL